MTISEMQDFLCKELSALFSDYPLRSSNGKVTSNIAVYSQDLPIPENDDDDEAMPPYIIVQLVGGEQESWDSNFIIEIILVVCVWDDATRRQGSKDVLSIITRIHQMLMRHPALNGLFEPPFKFKTSDEDTFPYYYGACQFKATVSAVRRESPLA